MAAFDSGVFRNATAITVVHVVAVEPGGYDLIECRVGKQVASKHSIVN